MANEGETAKTGRTWPDVFADFSKLLLPAALLLVVALVLLLVLGKAVEVGPWKIQITDPTKRLVAVQVAPPGTSKDDLRFPKGGWGVDKQRGSAGGNGAVIPGSEEFAFCSVSGVWVTPKIDDPSNCELYQNSSRQWVIRVTHTASCQVTCFR